MKYSENAWLLGTEYIFLEVFDYGLRSTWLLAYSSRMEVITSLWK